MNDNRIAILIKRLSLEFDKISNPSLAPYDLTLSQFKILKYLYHHENVIGKELQDVFSMTNPTLTGILQNMESGGWIVREVSPFDTRSKIITLTEKALSKEDEFYHLGLEFENKFSSNLTKDEEEELLFLLNKVMEGIKK